MNAIALIEAERIRQIEIKGWSRQHDDSHTNGDIAAAAACYAELASQQSYAATPDVAYYRRRPSIWPWGDAHWRPSDDTVRNLVKAGALIIAEIERLQRLDNKPFTPTESDIAAAREIIERGSL